MHPYPHIDSVYKRDERGRFMEGEFSTPEFEFLADKPWQWTEKIDGTNIRVMWYPQGSTKTTPDGANDRLGPLVEFGGKTDNAQIPAKLIAVLQNLFPVEKMQAAFPDNPMCLYGEGYGAGIQKGGGNYRPDQSFILFDVKIGNWWLLRKDIEDIAQKLGIDVVPLIEDNPFTLEEVIEWIADCADDNAGPTTAIGGTALIEGVVGQPVIPLFNRKGGRVITKVKIKDFVDLGKQKELATV